MFLSCRVRALVNVCEFGCGIQVYGACLEKSWTE